MLGLCYDYIKIELGLYEYNFRIMLGSCKIYIRIIATLGPNLGISAQLKSCKFELASWVPEGLYYGAVTPTHPPA